MMDNVIKAIETVVKVLNTVKYMVDVKKASDALNTLKDVIANQNETIQAMANEIEVLKGRKNA